MNLLIQEFKLNLWTFSCPSKRNIIGPSGLLAPVSDKLYATPGVFLDLGSGTSAENFKYNDYGQGNSWGQSIPLFYRMYYDRCIVFKDIYAWEVGWIGTDQEDPEGRIHLTKCCLCFFNTTYCTDLNTHTRYLIRNLINPHNMVSTDDYYGTTGCHMLSRTSRLPQVRGIDQRKFWGPLPDEVRAQMRLYNVPVSERDCPDSPQGNFSEKLGLNLTQLWIISDRMSYFPIWEDVDWLDFNFWWFVEHRRHVPRDCDTCIPTGSNSLTSLFWWFWYSYLAHTQRPNCCECHPLLSLLVENVETSFVGWQIPLF